MKVQLKKSNFLVIKVHSACMVVRASFIVQIEFSKVILSTFTNVLQK